jgi:hypothetical protein
MTRLSVGASVRVSTLVYQEKQPNSMVDVAEKMRVQITTIEDVIVRTYYKDKPPRDNHEKRSKIDMAKQDLKAYA